jgi:alpha-glucosidase
MYFRKYPYPSNFDFATQLGTRLSERIGPVRLAARIDRFAGDVFRIRVTSPQWRQHSIAGLTPPRKVALDRGDVRLQVDRSLALTLKDGRGRTLLAQPRGHAFGVSGRSSMFVFNHEEGDQFYGMGEKLLGLELSNKQTKFWNTDVFADFHWKEVFEDRADPLYASIPYLIIKRGNTYVGLLLDNPQATFISTGANLQVGGGQMDLGTPARKVITIGGEDGQPDLYILVGPSLPELTRKLQQLVGVTPLPPAWALGYNQCRWGYQSADDLQELDRKFRQHRIPCDALWLDIDYMDAFKVFTFNKAHFPALRKTLKDLKSKGRRIVPILDPGVKQQKGYPVYDDGRRRDIFCRNPQGGEFIGLVWPGETAFPDFSMPEGRAWWARHVQAFGEQGIDGAWIDMNDPSTGSVQNSSMLFQRGRLGHATFHNQYALGMAMATRAGFAAAHPGQAPLRDQPQRLHRHEPARRALDRRQLLELPLPAPVHPLLPEPRALGRALQRAGHRRLRGRLSREPAARLAEGRLPVPVLPQPHRHRHPPPGAVGLRRADPERLPALHPPALQAAALPLQPVPAPRRKRRGHPAPAVLRFRGHARLPAGPHRRPVHGGPRPPAGARSCGKAPATAI